MSQYMTLENLLKKIIPREEIPNLINKWHNQNEKIVFTNGCFDLIHPGHISLLCKASELGTKLIVGLNSDSSVQRLKGKYRPILDQNARALILAALQFTNVITIFDEDTPYDLIKIVRPHVLVKGKDYKLEEIVGYDIVTQLGGQIVTIELIPGYSTTAIEKKILFLSSK